MTRLLTKKLGHGHQGFYHFGDSVLDLVKLSIVHKSRCGHNFPLLINADFIHSHFHVFSPELDSFAYRGRIRPPLSGLFSQCDFDLQTILIA